MEINEVIPIYNEKKDDYLRLITSYQYIFEVTKCCGYGEWVSVYKDLPLNQLYENIKNQFGGFYKPNNLCVLDNNLNKLHIPQDETMTLRTFILNNPSFFRPIYPLPAYVIYRIFIDDGCCHKALHNDDVNAINDNNKTSDKNNDDENKKCKNTKNIYCFLHNCM